jgi:hypothetical protein
MLILAFALTLFSARQDIADEIEGSQHVGQLMTVLSALQDGATLEQHALRIDQLNRSETLRHFHVALLDSRGQRLTQIADPLPHRNDLAGIRKVIAHRKRLHAPSANQVPSLVQTQGDG